MSTMKKVMHYLGLGPDDDYQSAPPPVGMAPSSAAAPVAVGTMGEFESGGDVRPLGPVDPQDGPGLSVVPASPSAKMAAGSSMVGASIGGGSGGSRLNTVRPIPAGSMASLKPSVIEPVTFNDAQEVGDKFRNGKPVIMNLRTVERDLARRLIDFASGLCYGLRGDMEKVDDKVYLLTPAGVEISPEDRIDLRDQGLVGG